MLLAFLIVNFTGTLLAVRALTDARRQMQEATGYTLGVRGVAFNVFQGLRLSGVVIQKGDQSLFDAERVDVGFEGVSYVRGPVRIKQARMTTVRLVTARFTELIDVMRRFSQKGLPVALYDTFHFSCRDMFFDNMIHMGLSGYLNAVNGQMYTLRGRLTVFKIRYPAFPEFDVFEGSAFYQPFDYEFQATRGDDTFEIAPIELSNTRLKIYGGATIKGLSRAEPAVDLKLEMVNILLDDLPVLNRGNVRARGVIDAVGILKGPIQRPDTSLSVTLKNGEMAFFDALFFSKMKGTAVFAHNQFLSRDMTLDLNGVPFDTELKVFALIDPRIALSLRSQRDVAGAPQFTWQLDGTWKGDHLQGDAEGTVRSAARNSAQQVSFKIDDFRLGYDEDLYLYARTFDLGVNVAANEPASTAGSFDRGARLEYLYGVLRNVPDGFGFKHVKASCYGGTLEGEAYFTSTREQVFAKGEAHVRDVDIRQYVETSSPNSTLTQGQLDGDLRFDNRQDQQIQGQVFVTAGEIERNPILNAVADFLGIVSMKHLAFGNLSVFFNGGRGDYNVKVQLVSEALNAELESKIQAYETMDGYLSATLSTRLLNESRSFSRLLRFLKHDEPSVVFPFKISSYLASPRILWLKNEFKEKIQNKLPERNKRGLQAQVNNFVEQAGN
ncbi:MAG: hypothetical protein ACM3L6_05560 [Deltaproteobacteria bacterium]